VTTDEELNHLEDCVRRLKVEYDIYFGGGSKKAPFDLEWRVRGLIKKFSDSHRLSSQQRFQYNSVVERFAIYSDLWRQKLRIREEGYRRPQDALLGVSGVRSEQGDQPPPECYSVVLTFTDPSELNQVGELYRRMVRAAAGGGVLQPAGAAGKSLDSFKNFLKTKTSQLQSRYGCRAVEYTVQVKDGRVRIKARPAL
jgi:hypothetical protein